MKGLDDTWAIMVYYAPDLMKKTVDVCSDLSDESKIEFAIDNLNTCFEYARSHIKNRKGSGVFTIKVTPLLDLLKDTQKTVAKLGEVICLK